MKITIDEKTSLQVESATWTEDVRSGFFAVAGPTESDSGKWEIWLTDHDYELDKHFPERLLFTVNSTAILSATELLMMVDGMSRGMEYGMECGRATAKREVRQGFRILMGLDPMSVAFECHLADETTPQNAPEIGCDFCGGADCADGKQPNCKHHSPALSSAFRWENGE